MPDEMRDFVSHFYSEFWRDSSDCTIKVGVSTGLHRACKRRPEVIGQDYRKESIMSIRRKDQYPDCRCEGMTFMFSSPISIANLPQYAHFAQQGYNKAPAEPQHGP